MRIHLFHDLKPIADVGKITSKNPVDRLVRTARELGKLVT